LWPAQNIRIFLSSLFKLLHGGCIVALMQIGLAQPPRGFGLPFFLFVIGGRAGGRENYQNDACDPDYKISVHYHLPHPNVF
jgi:hypothetical protein